MEMFMLNTMTICTLFIFANRGQSQINELQDFVI